MKEISNYLIIKIKLESIKLKESRKCTNCGYEGLIECWKPVKSTGTNYKCPNCKFTFGIQISQD